MDINIDLRDETSLDVAGQVLDEGFYAQVRDTLEEARKRSYAAVNTEMVHAYWNIGKLIVEEQGGEGRAEYGTKVIKLLSEKLTSDFGKGFTVTNLKYMREFYLAFPIGHALSDQLTWTHYRHLLKVKDAKARDFYMEECAKANWSTRQLERQINSLYYQRLLASQNKETASQEIFELEPSRTPEDFLKDPYVLEFAGLQPSSDYLEKELESALIGKLQDFLLELGRGFSFVSRQMRVSLGGDHFYIDLVFYNYLLKCFVLIDLKTTALSHQDVGQMDTYIRVFDDVMKGDDDNPTIGIILCADKNDTVAKYSILNDSKQLFASKYQLTLPTEEELAEYLHQERLRIEERQLLEEEPETDEDGR